MPRFGRVVLGGTYDHLHAGHEALLRTAFQLGRSVAIGLTSPTFLARHPKPLGRSIASEAVRRRALVRWLKQNYPRARWAIVPIDDPFGGAVGDGVDAIVVSADTVRGGRAVNRERRRRGRAAVPLVVVPLVLADDLQPLSSRRIRAGEVDRDGHRRSPLRVGFAAAEDAARPAVVRGLRRAFPRVELGRPTPFPSGRLSAAGLRRLAKRARGRAELGVAVGRRGPGGWLVAIQGLRVGLDPRRVPGRTSRDLELGLARLLRPHAP